jgi:hypothetical protein
MQIRLGSLLLLALLCMPGVAFGQNFRGAVSGTVTDPKGAAIPGAKVTLTDLVVHPPSLCSFRQLGDARLTTWLMSATSPPNKWMTVFVPISCGGLNRLLDFGPGFETAAFECERA